MLEPSIAAKAAERISKEQLDILKTLVFDQHRAVLENRDDSAEDQRFHRILAESINNRAVLDVLDVVDNLLNNTRSAPLRDAQRGLASVKGHMRIVDALERHDANEARRTMQSHLEEVRQKALK
jgi:GntR family transcriptional repressor for pyruvate dehydrogenase complex